MIFFSSFDVSVWSVIPYLAPKAVNSVLLLKQVLTDSGIESPNFSIRSLRESKSLIEPLAAFSRTVPMKATVVLAVASSKHGTTVVVSGSLFSSKSPFKSC